MTASKEISTIALNNGKRIPQLGLGVWQIPNGKPVENAVTWALDAGYRHIDTARIYGNEEGVGRAVRNSGIPRAELFITSKVWNADQGYDKTLKAAELSLKNLGMDYLDLYLVHFPVTGLRLQTWKAMEYLVSTGKCLSVGVSNFMLPHLRELLAEAKIIPAVNQIELHPFLQMRELKAYGESHQIKVQAYSPLAHGKKLQDPVIAQLAQKYGKSPAQVMIRWSLQQGNIVIPKSSTQKRIEENIQVFDFQLSPEDLQTLDALESDYRTCWDPTEIE